MILYHGSSKKIKNWKPNRPVWLSSNIDDAKKAVVCQQLVDETNGLGYIYSIEIDLKECGKTSDTIEFHGGTYFELYSENIVNMISNDIDNNWYAVRDINKFNPKLIK